MSYGVVEERCPDCKDTPQLACGRCFSTGWLEVYRYATETPPPELEIPDPANTDRPRG